MTSEWIEFGFLHLDTRFPHLFTVMRGRLVLHEEEEGTERIQWIPVAEAVKCTKTRRQREESRGRERERDE